MKKVFLSLFLLILLTVPTYATENNGFFNLHADECVSDGREYILNDPNGYLTVLDAPDGRVQDYLLNEQILTVFGIYTDAAGCQWAQLRYSVPERGIALSSVDGDYIGWALLSSFYREMNAHDFLLLHQDEFVFSPLRLRPTDYPDATLWLYPGAALPGGYLHWYIKDENALLSFPAWWRDRDGYRWAYWENSFICLDDPERTISRGEESIITYPAVSKDRLPLVIKENNPAERPSLIPYYLLAAAAGLAALSRWIRKFSNNERK